MSRAQWFSALELVELALPALAGSRFRIQEQAKSEGWQSRPREGRGGGSEYYIGSLPEAARIELARRSLANLNSTSAPLSSPSGFVATGTALAQAGTAFPLSPSLAPQGERGGKAFFLSVTKPDTRAQTRGAARNIIIGLLKTFAEAGGLSMVAARASFAALFNAGEIPVEAWVKAEFSRLTVRSLERWTWQVSREGAQRLAGRYGHRKGKGQIEGEPTLRDFCIAQMAARPKLTAQQLLDFMRAAHGVEIPRRTVQRFMSTARINHANAFLAAQNPDAWKNKRMVAFGSRSENVAGPNAVWEIDASPADVLVVQSAEGARRRLTLVGIVDVWTRRAMVLVSETPRATAATLLIRKAIMAWGVPAVIKTDNGKDFVSAHMARSLGALMIEQKPCPPFTPEGKPHIERFFGTLTRDFISLLPGFIGHDVADRKAIEARRSFADRFGDADKVIEISLTHEDLQAKINDWVEHSYNRVKHGGIGTSPMLKLMEWTGTTARIESERALDVLLAEAPDAEGLRVVTKKGIRVENATFIAPDLALHIGERVQIRLDPEDMGRIIVYSIEGEFICVAECPERTGVDRQELAAAAKDIQRKNQKDIRAQMRANAREHRPHEILDEVMAMKREDAARVVQFPGAGGTSEAYSTPMLEAAGEAARRLAGIRNEPAPLSEAERELAAEGMAKLPTADIIELPQREEEAQTAPAFLDDFEFVLFGLSHPEQLSDTQKRMWDELMGSRTIKVRLAAWREANQA